MNVIFSNNGANQHPDVQAKPGATMILTAEGQWTLYAPPQEEGPSTTPSDPTVPLETPPVQDPVPKKTFPIIPVVSVFGSLCLVGLLAFFMLKKRKK